jgi:hypothetical protein
VKANGNVAARVLADKMVADGRLPRLALGWDPLGLRDAIDTSAQELIRRLAEMREAA